METLNQNNRKNTQFSKQILKLNWKISRVKLYNRIFGWKNSRQSKYKHCLLNNKHPEMLAHTHKIIMRLNFVNEIKKHRMKYIENVWHGI